MSELVELGDNETLISESGGKSAAEMKKAFQESNPVINETEDSEVEEQEEVQEEVIETKQEPEPRTQNQEPKFDIDEAYRKGVQDVLEQLKGQLNTQTKTPENIKRTSPEEILEEFTKDPENFLTRLIEQKITPHRHEISKIEEHTIRTNARRSNPDFARLEPVVDKIKDMHPELVKGKTVSETMEVYYLIAKGMEAQEAERRSQSSKDQQEKQRQSAKRSASMLPKGTRQTPSTSDDKPFTKLSSAEMKKRISEMTRGR